MTASPKILDFGLARIEREEPVPLDSDMPTLTMDEQPPSLTQGKGFMGTPSYMSPEQIEGTDGELLDWFLGNPLVGGPLCGN